MPRRNAKDRRTGLWRVIAIVLAAGLGTAAVALVVFASSTKQAQVGVLLGAWAVVIAAPGIFGSRRGQQQAAQLREAQQHAARLNDAQLEISQLQKAHLEETRESAKSQEVELRRFGELQLAREAAARREADFRLEIALRADIERALADHVGALREEVSALRAEVVDKLGGQLRLERIETTRVIASDLEALQHEIRRLGGSQESLAAAPHFSRTVHSSSVTPPAGSGPDVERSRPAGPRPTPDRRPIAEPRPAAGQQPSPKYPRPAVPVNDDIVDAELVDADGEDTAVDGGIAVHDEMVAAVAHDDVETDVAHDVQADATDADGYLAHDDVAEADVTEADVAEPPAAAVPPPPAQRQPVTSGMKADPFAGLPRLTPLPRDLAYLLEPDAASTGGAAGEKDSGQRRAADPDSEPAEDPKYIGRRRAAAEAAAQEQPTGRRRAPDDAPDDLMARLRGR